MLDSAMMTDGLPVYRLGCGKHIIIITKTSNGSESIVAGVYGQTNIVKMNDNRWFEYDNDDNVCEKIFSLKMTWLWGRYMFGNVGFLFFRV